MKSKYFKSHYRPSSECSLSSCKWCRTEYVWSKNGNCTFVSNVNDMHIIYKEVSLGTNAVLERMDTIYVNTIRNKVARIYVQYVGLENTLYLLVFCMRLYDLGERSYGCLKYNRNLLKKSREHTFEGGGVSHGHTVDRKCPLCLYSVSVWYVWSNVENNSTALIKYLNSCTNVLIKVRIKFKYGSYQEHSQNVCHHCLPAHGAAQNMCDLKILIVHLLVMFEIMLRTDSD